MTAPKAAASPRAEILNISHIQELNLEQPKELIEGLITTPGLWLEIGAQKAGKTILAVQMALITTRRHPSCSTTECSNPNPRW